MCSALVKGKAVNEIPYILIVDDESVVRQALSVSLAGQGYDLAFACDGREGLVKAAERVPDLILLDVMMPGGLDGFEVCYRLRSDPTCAEVPIIMVTGLADQDSRIKGIEAGADDFIAKPVDIYELRARVRTLTWLNRRRKMRTLELQAERDRTRAILEALGEAVFVTDLQGTIQYVNPSAASLVGSQASELVGQNWRLWQEGQSTASLYDQIEEMTRSGREWRGEVIGRRQDGTTYDAMLTVAPLFDPSDDQLPLGFVSVQRDITPLKEAERLKDQFVSNVSHELSTPLSVITLLADNMSALYTRLDDTKRRKMIQDIQKHTRVLNDLIDDILQVSRLDSGRISTEREQIDLPQLVGEEIDKQLPLAREKHQDLHDTAGHRLAVWGNDRQLRRAIGNLINNAIKYTPPGGQITCECAVLQDNGCPNEGWPGSTDLDGQWAAVRVIDTGIGISEQNLPHIFERFYRVETQGNIRGTGLGLSIANELVALHGGHIAAASTPGQGSVFAIYLPLLEEKMG
jgi:PAS domain S-box-containing protein